jgi:hypothetical protein
MRVGVNLKNLLSLVLVMLASFPSMSFAGEEVSLEVQIQTLEPIIGGYPPNIHNEAEASAVRSRYIEIKAALDERLSHNPKDQQLLFMRGHLQSMGHNFDYPNALQGSEKDLKEILSENPAHIPAILELARLWVNSNPALAPNAENLFRGAQCFNGKEPLEDAQSGLFFAFYFQGKMKEALLQSEYLKQTWPQNEKYQKFNETVRAALSRSGAKEDSQPPTLVKLTMATCNE